MLADMVTLAIHLLAVKLKAGLDVGDGHIGFTVKDGIVHTGLSGKAQAGMLTVDGTVEARLGYGVDFGSLDGSVAREITPGYGGYGQPIPLDILRELQKPYGLDGKGNRLPAGHNLSN